MPYLTRLLYCLLFYLFAVLPSGAIAQKDTIRFGEESSYKSTPGSVSMLPVKGKADFPAALKDWKEGKFTTPDSRVINIGISRNPYWFHFVVKNENQEDAELIIDIENPRLNHITLYEYGRDSAWLNSETGDFFPFSQRKVKHKNFLFPSVIPPGETRDYFLYVDQVGHTLYLPVSFISQKTFEDRNSLNYFTDGITYGILLFMSFLSLFFFLSTLHSLYLYYGLYIFSAIGWFLSYFGLGYQYIWYEMPGFSSVGAPFFASINLLLNIQICQVLLRVRENNTVLYQIGIVLKALLLLTALFPIVVNLNSYGFDLNYGYLLVFLTLILTSLVYLVYVISVYAFRGSFIAQFYFLASVLKIPSLLNLALFELGITPGQHNMEEFLQSGILVEIIILSYAIAKRYTLFKFQTFQSVIQAQEEERKNFSKELHDGISNSLTGIKFSIQEIIRKLKGRDDDTIHKLTAVSESIGQVQTEARNLSHSLMPSYIKNNSFIEIMRLYINGLQHSSLNREGGRTFPVIYFSANKEKVPMQDDMKLHLFRVMQEIISNMIRHSGATVADVVITVDNKEIVIVTSDNGSGIDTDKHGKFGIGLSNISSRIELLNGKIEFMDTIAEEPGIKPVNGRSHKINKGTTIVIKVPLGKLWNFKSHRYDY